MYVHVYLKYKGHSLFKNLHIYILIKHINTFYDEFLNGH